MIEGCAQVLLQVSFITSPFHTYM